MADFNSWGSEFYRFHGIPRDTQGEPIEDSFQGHSMAYTNNVWVNKCVNVKMTAAQSVPLRVVDSTKENEPVENHPVLELMYQTNPLNYVQGGDLHKFTLGDLELNGEAYWQLVTNSAGVLKEIYWRSSGSMEPVPDPRAFIGGYKLKNQSGGDVLLKPAEVAFFKYPSVIDPMRGLGKVSAARDAINLDIFATQSSLALQRNGSRPDWMLLNKNAGNVGQDKQQGILSQIRQWLGGPQNRGKPLVLGGDWDVKTVTMSPADAQWDLLKVRAMEEICAVFEVAPELAGSTQHSTYNNVSEARARFWQDTMIPWLDWYSDQMTRQILRKVDKNANLRFAFDYSEIEGLAEDTSKVWDRFLQLMDRVNVSVERRITTPNGAGQILAEAARELGIDDQQFAIPVPGGDTFMVPLSSIPIEEASVQANIDVTAARGNAALEQPVPGAEQQAPQLVGVDAPATPSNIVPLRGAASDEPREERKARPDPKRIRDVRLGKHQKTATQKLKKEFQRQQVEALRYIRGQASAVAEAASVTVGMDLKAALSNEEFYNRQKAQEELLAIISGLQGASLEEAVSAASEDYGLQVSWDIVNPKLEDIRSSLAGRVTGIDDTTAKSIQDAVVAGIDAGETFQQGIAQRISDIFGTAINSRSEMIARTESMQAYAGASLVAYTEAGVEQVEMYDGDYDEECAAVNGEVVNLDEADALMADEHPNGTRGVSPVVDLGMGSQAAEE